jgi:hypothetical protein
MRPVVLIASAATEACWAGTVPEKLHPLLHAPPHMSKNARSSSPNTPTDAILRFAGARNTRPANATYPTHMSTIAVISIALGCSGGVHVGDPVGIRVGEWVGDEECGEWLGAVLTGPAVGERVGDDE